MDDLLHHAKELSAHFYICDTSFDLFGLDCRELQEGKKIERCGVATFLSNALNSKITLFV